MRSNARSSAFGWPVIEGRFAFWRRLLRPRYLTSLVLSGCHITGAPSFVIVGSYFPGWMFCAVIGVASAISARLIFVAANLAGVLPFQLFLCAAIGTFCALVAWLLLFGL